MFISLILGFYEYFDYIFDFEEIVIVGYVKVVFEYNKWCGNMGVCVVKIEFDFCLVEYIGCSFVFENI